MNHVMRFSSLLMLTTVAATLSLPSIGCGAAADEDSDTSTNDLGAPIDCSNPPPLGLTPAQRKWVKFRPGHYYYYGGTDVAKPLADIEGTDVAGVLLRYEWAQLESTPDAYDFSAIESDLAATVAKTKRFAIMLSWKYTAPPAYLAAYATSASPYRFPLTGGTDGWLTNLGNGQIAGRFTKLVAALAAKFDSTPGFVGVVYPETSLSATLSKPQEDAYFANLAKIDRASACYFRHTPITQLTNFPVGHLNTLIQGNFVPGQVGLGGPDTFLGDVTLDAPGRLYDYLDQVAGTLPIMMFAQGRDFAYASKKNIDDDVPDGLDFATSITLHGAKAVSLHANYVFWRPLGGYRSEFLTQARDHLLPPVSTACPSVYGNACLK